MAIAINGSTNVITGVGVGGLPDGIVDADMLAANAVTAGKLASGVGGKILQVVQTVKKDVYSGNHYGNFNEITGLSLSITPTSSSNKILFTLDISYSIENGSIFYVKLYDGSSEITGANSTTGSSINAWIATYKTGSTTNMISDQIINVSKNYLHTVSDTNAHTYKIYAHSASATFYINRSENSGGAGSTSVLTAMEVAA